MLPIPRSYCFNLFSSSISSVKVALTQQTRSMSKYLSKQAGKRRPLSPKHAGKGYYKGNGCRKEGTFRGRAGRFVLDRSRLLELVVPDMTGFKLKPYIGRNVPKWAPEDRF